MIPQTWPVLDLEGYQMYLIAIGAILFLAVGKHLLGSELYASSFMIREPPREKKPDANSSSQWNASYPPIVHLTVLTLPAEPVVEQAA